MKDTVTIYLLTVAVYFFLVLNFFSNASAASLTSYSKPMFQDYRLDWCLDWAENCGEPAATAYCKHKHHSGANSWKQAADIGNIASTKTLGSGEICDKPFCDGFSEIVCEDIESDIIYDFVKEAPTAKWTNAWKVLSFPGSDSDEEGFVRVLNNAKMENTNSYRHVLQTHPHWQPRGRIIGRYPDITIPEQGAEFRAEIGFLEGSQKTDGVYFEILSEFPDYNGIPLRRGYHKKYSEYLINDYSHDLSLYRGMTGTIALSVDAGEKSSSQDWAAWVNPRLVSLKNEYAFASFVGGAIGSKRNGKTLLNPWGGKSGQLFGNVVLYLAFANVNSNESIKIDSYFNDQFMGTTDLGTVTAGQKELWHNLQRTQEGAWRERIIFNGTYVGDLRYMISKAGE